MSIIASKLADVGMQQPNWIEFTVTSSALELEEDLNARPDSPRRFRWRRKAYTGEPINEWIYGATPLEVEHD